MATAKDRLEAFTSPVITLLWYKKGNMTCFRPDTVQDGTVLNSIFGKRYFAYDEYHRVLEGLSEFGYCAQTADPEGIFGKDTR